jgi:hypothetical protein
MRLLITIAIENIILNIISIEGIASLKRRGQSAGGQEEDRTTWQMYILTRTMTRYLYKLLKKMITRILSLSVRTQT